MLVPKFEPALFFWSMRFIQGDVQEWPISGNAVVMNFELDRLLQSEPDQDEVSGDIQDEVVIIIGHYSLNGECDEWVNQLSILS
jgi:hypothetical protein